MGDQAAANRQVCIAPLSSPYSLLPRVHTYALIAALIIPLPRGWLFRAALAAFTTRTAIFAIDAAVILHAVSGATTLTTEPVPLDSVVVLEILGLAVIVACWLLLASRRASESSARPLIRIWAGVVTVGFILSFVAVAKLGTFVATAHHRATETEYDECEGIWMDVLDVFGTPETVPVLGEMGWKFGWVERRVGIPALIFSAVALLGIFLPKGRTFVARAVDVEENSPEMLRNGSGAMQRQLGPVHQVLVVLLWLGLPAMSIFMAVSTEQYLQIMTSNIPSVEKMGSVGQWGVWAGTGAVLVATLINAMKEKMGLDKTVME
jgi:hypothetical protein